MSLLPGLGSAWNSLACFNGYVGNLVLSVARFPASNPRSISSSANQSLPTKTTRELQKALYEYYLDSTIKHNRPPKWVVPVPSPAQDSPSNEAPQPNIETILGRRQLRLQNLDRWLEDQGIGGSSPKLQRVLRDLLRSRCLDETDRNAFGLKHHKGVLLYGPPGNGKTLLARSLADLLCIKPENVKIINASEIETKYVGETEERINRLFAPAQEDWKKHGENADLHGLIFDEIDSLGRRRGADCNPHADRTLNMLLACIDGMTQIENLIIFGLTNRIDILDPALVRPGRLGLHIEIPLPSLEARKSILRIHTAPMREHHRAVLNDDDFTCLATQTSGFSAAELAAVVQEAVVMTLDTHHILGKVPDELKVHFETFMDAVESIQRSR